MRRIWLLTGFRGRIWTPSTRHTDKVTFGPVLMGLNVDRDDRHDRKYPSKEVTTDEGNQTYKHGESLSDPAGSIEDLLDPVT